MPKLFKLSVLTPEKNFYDGSAEAIIIRGQDGELCIYADHEPMVVTLPVGSVRIKNDKGQWREAFNAKGFVEVSRTEVLVFVHACEWPEDIDLVRAKRRLEEEKEKLRQKQSLNEYKASKVALAREMERLRIGSKNINN